MTYFFTGDHHFGHRRLLEVRNERRVKAGLVPFSSRDEMDEFYIEAHNSVVKTGDVVHHLGDISWRPLNETTRIRHRLNGAIVLIRGNHDHRQKWLKDLFYGAIFDVKLFRPCDTNQDIWLSHYAHRVWPKSHYGSWHLYGHSHGSLPDDPHSRSIDVGVDVTYESVRPGAPLSFEQIKEIMSHKNFVPVDHHEEEE
jgi:calcineurin-like phosphoesterase family protein